MSDRTYAHIQAQQKTLSGTSPKSGLLQRTCACGQHTIAGGECDACRSEQYMLLRSQRAFLPTSAPVTVQGSAPAQENGTSFNSAFGRASRFGHDFSRIPVYSSHSPVLQTKLTVNQPEDTYEQEADHVAEQVMRMNDRGPSVADDEDEAKTSFMRKQSSEPQADTGADISSVPIVVHTVLNSGGGQPLDSATRAFMEPRFGHDFSQVRVHTDGKSAESARAVNALAYTVGRDVVFSTGQFSPTSSAGQKLIAHELTHVVQQSEGNSGRGTIQRQKDPTPQRAEVKQPSDGILEDTWYDLWQQMDQETADERIRTETNMKRFEKYPEATNQLWWDMRLLEVILNDYHEEISRNEGQPDNTNRVSQLYDVWILALGVVKQDNDALDAVFVTGIVKALIEIPFEIMQLLAKRLLEHIEILKQELEKAKEERLEAGGKLVLDSLVAGIDLLVPEVGLIYKVGFAITEEGFDFFFPGPEVSERGAHASTAVKRLAEVVEEVTDLEKFHNIAKGATKTAAVANVLFSVDKFSVSIHNVDRIRQLMSKANNAYEHLAALIKRVKPKIVVFRWNYEREQASIQNIIEIGEETRYLRDMEIKRTGYKYRL